jgi:catechol 2,3-dioxygenase-like lactoylglutathione lyase family enzyme
MLSYVYFGTNDLERAIGFYNATLGALGMRRVVTNDPAWDRVSAGWGMYEDDGMRELAFWIGKPFDQQPANVGNGSMVAFRARNLEGSRRFSCRRAR